MGRPVLYRAGAVGLGLAVAFLAAEGGLRALRLSQAGGVFTVTESEYARIPGIFSPGQRFLDQRKPALPHRITIDSLGYRGADFPRDKPAGEIRIVVAGDSFTWGDFVDDEETLPAQLERVLGAWCGARIRVVNAGIPSTTIDAQREMVVRSLELSPDWVLLVAVGNDLTDLLDVPIWSAMARNRRAKSRFPLGVVYPWLRETALWNLGLSTWRTFWAAYHTGTPGASVAADSMRDLRLDTAAAAYQNSLFALRDTLRSVGVPLLVVGFPGKDLEVEADSARSQVQRILKIAEAGGIGSVNLLDDFTSTGRPYNTFYLAPLDAHPSPLGYTVAADAVADAMASTAPGGWSCDDEW